LYRVSGNSSHIISTGWSSAMATVAMKPANNSERSPQQRGLLRLATVYLDRVERALRGQRA
jgi:hypothetical protein